MLPFPSPSGSVFSLHTPPIQHIPARNKLPPSPLSSTGREFSGLTAWTKEERLSQWAVTSATARSPEQPTEAGAAGALLSLSAEGGHFLGNDGRAVSPLYSFSFSKPLLPFLFWLLPLGLPTYTILPCPRNTCLNHTAPQAASIYYLFTYPEGVQYILTKRIVFQPFPLDIKLDFL